MRRLTLIVALAALLALGPVVAQIGAAQSAPWILLQGPDGSLWIVADGVRHRALPLSVNDATLAVYPEAEPWIGQLGTTGPQQPAPPPPAAPPPPPPYDATADCTRISLEIADAAMLGGAAAQELRNLCLQLAAQYGPRGVQCFEIAFRAGVRQHLSGNATMALLQQCLGQ